ncbi:hypothetical protein J3E64_002418 [Sphingobium sp. OAS761]|uniref:hypothetical protein n=1 Tax=Sphingobium sp. OAS761 TaxID=2817901 RepID=UPI0020A0C428|nr:hypothetical protein [Sphingobium sp. OAS761]MCP1470725.1 hypothetical protein [Sphingobium sp. OAS761]
MIEEPADTAVTPQTEGPDDPSDDGSVRESFARLYADIRAYAGAEAERQKLRASIVATGVRNAAILGFIGLMLIFASIVALLVGLVLVLQSALGALGATLAVTGGGLAVAIVLLLLAKACVGATKKALEP